MGIIGVEDFSEFRFAVKNISNQHDIDFMGIGLKCGRGEKDMGEEWGERDIWEEWGKTYHYKE